MGAGVWYCLVWMRLWLRFLERRILFVLLVRVVLVCIVDAQKAVVVVARKTSRVETTRPIRTSSTRSKSTDPSWLRCLRSPPASRTRLLPSFVGFRIRIFFRHTSKNKRGIRPRRTTRKISMQIESWSHEISHSRGLKATVVSALV